VGQEILNQDSRIFEGDRCRDGDDEGCLGKREFVCFEDIKEGLQKKLIGWEQLVFLRGSFDYLTSHPELLEV